MLVQVKQKRDKAGVRAAPVMLDGGRRRSRDDAVAKEQGEHKRGLWSPD